MSAVSSSFTHTPPLTPKSAPFRSSWKIAFGTQRLACNLSVRNLVRPKHLSDRSGDHDYVFGLPSMRGAGRSIINPAVLLPTKAISELSRVRTKLR